MNNNVSKIKTLYAYEDGDTITPRMGVQIATGHGLQQFYNAQTWNVTNTNFADYPATLFPQPYSSKAGAIVVPAAGGQWYFNNIADNAGILDANGAVKSAFADRFAVTTVVMNGKTFPALKIKSNLVNSTNKISTDIYIYYVGQYNGKQFTCDQRIPVQSVVGDAYQLLVSVIGPNGAAGDEVISSPDDFIEYTASLQMMSTGTDIAAAVITFEHFEADGTWKAVTNNSGITEITGKKMKLYQLAVDGSELYRVKAVYNGENYYQMLNPTDEQDPYYIVDGCSIDGDTVQRSDTVTWNPKVFQRVYDGEDEDVTTKEGWEFKFTLVAQKTGVTITEIDQTGITYEKLTEYGGIATRIQASRP